MSFWTRSEKLPPILVRLLARRPHGPPLDTLDIAVASGGLSAYQVDIISHATNWNGIPFDHMRAFLTGCGVDFENSKQMERVASYLRSRPTWQHLRKDKLWRAYYQPLMLRYRASVTKGKL